MYFKLGKRYQVKISGEIIVPVIVLIFTIAYYTQVVSLSFESLLLAKPLLYFSFILSLFIIIRYGIKIEPDKPIGDKSFLTAAMFNNLNIHRKTITIMISFLIFLILIEKIGFIITGFLYLIIAMRFLGERKVLRSILISLSLTMFVYSLFKFWFRVPLPSGILENYFLR